MDNPKRKLRSGKEVLKDKGQSKEKSDDTGTGDVSSAPKRAKASDDLGHVCVVEESESVTVEDRSEECGSPQTDDVLICSLCNFVAKTQTALKIHSTRKHSHKGGLQNDTVNAPGLNSLQNTPPLQETDAFEKDKQSHTHQPSENEVKPVDGRTSPTQMLLDIVEPNPCGSGKDEDTSKTFKEGRDTQRQHDNKKDLCRNTKCDNEKHSPKMLENQNSAGGRTSPTQMLLEIVEPNPCGSGKDKDTSKIFKNAKDIQRKHDNKKDDEKHSPKMLENQDSLGGRTSPTQMLLEIVEPNPCGSGKDKDTSKTFKEAKDTQRPHDNKKDDEKHSPKMLENQDLLKKGQESMRLTGGRSSHQCGRCDFTADNSLMLAQHIKTSHPLEHRFHCQVCHYYTSTAEAMELHLSEDAHQQLAKEKSTSPLFKDCVEKILVILSDQKEDSNDPEAEEPVRKGSPHKRKRGRPKTSSETVCSHCGLIASNATNLSVHIRRRHSRMYSFVCKLCNYYCVTKGDMDRHCETKKHINKMQAAGSDDSGVVLLDAEQTKKTDLEVAEIETTIEEEDADLSSIPYKKSKPDSGNLCSQCDFIAHSTASLALHVRRKHTKDFEFVCLACSYYTVTRREMFRHMATEKHKQKREGYLKGRSSEEPEDSTETFEERCADENGAHQPALKNTSKDNEESPTDPIESDTVQSIDGNDEDGAQQPTVKNTAKVNEESPTDPIESDTVQSIDGNDEDGAQQPALKNTSKDNEESPTDPIESDMVQSMDGNDEDEAQQPTVKNMAKVNEESPTDPIESDMVQSMDGNDEDGAQQPALKNTSKDNKEAPSDPIESDAILLIQKEDVDEDDEDEIADLGDDCASGEKHLRGVQFDACIYPLKTLPEHMQTSHYREQTQPMRKPKSLDTKSTSRIRCEDCGFLADGLSGLNVHISMKHPSDEKHFHCLLCGKSFYTESNLQQHLSSAAHMRNEHGSVEDLPDGGASFKCVRCSEPCQTEQELFVHIKEKHEELLREVNKYVMEDTEQINRERQENQGSVCKYCGKVCKSSNSMAFLAHIRTHTGSKPFMCKICNFATAQMGDARNHVKRHLGMREYKCHICGWAFVMKKHLNTHLLGKHGLGQPKERKFECDLCERTFSEKWALNNHMKLHTGDKPFKCGWPSCHYSFLTLSAMKDHHRTHTGEKSFLCDLCGFAGGTRHALTKHRRQHTGERPFRCQLCSFASTTQSHLTRHKRVHTGEKPYRCPWCDYRSNCAENIRKHILHTGKHEGVKMYNCPKCSYATNAPMDFRNHLKETHPDIENPDLAYLHAGIVSKSFECRLKGQGATFVQAEAAFVPEESEPGSEELQQVIIIQGYGGGEPAIDQALEESAAATLQTLAMSSQLTQLLITEDGQLISSRDGSGQTRYVLLDSGEAGEPGEPGTRSLEEEAAAGPESASALDALLCAVTELGQQGGAIEGEKAQAQGSPGGAERVEERVELMANPHTSEQMQEVLQFAASQLMMKEGLAQVIVNDEGTHYIVTQLDESTLHMQEPSGEETVVYSEVCTE
ncbi:zinc finger protein 407 [Pseudorasbora parva]